jgi:hypothetical protein
MRRCEWTWLLLLLLVAGGTAHAQAAAPVSDLQFVSSDAKLTQAFAWAKSQALAYAHGPGDPVGAWYEAALPGRNAFCMRDISHQTTGAAALGLYEANRNMLEHFAAAISPKRDWAGYWEIDKEGLPSPDDYENDDDFWYNLPANFDLLDANIRMWRWTGDPTFLTDHRFQQFFRRTSTDYLKAWQLDPADILSRPRIMNRRLRQGKFVRSRGIPSYTEGRDNFNVGTDLLAAEYRAFEDLSFLASMQKQADLSRKYADIAGRLLDLIETKAWSEKDHHFVGTLAEQGSVKGGDGDAMVLYFGAVRNPRHLQAALSKISEPDFREHIGIEEESYLPQILYRYGQSDAAYDTILDLASPDKQRREYPEVSYAVIAAIVTGTMGVDVSYEVSSHSFVVHSMARLAGTSEDAKISHLRILQNVVDLEHEGASKSSMTNRSGPSLRWRAEFCGKAALLVVAGHRETADVSQDANGIFTSSVLVEVPTGARVTVTRPEQGSPVGGTHP